MRLTIAMPAYDEVANVARAVDEARAELARTCPGDGELLIVDDGSRDGTGDLAARLAAQQSDVSVVRHGADRGFTGAMATCSREAAGDRIFPASADGQTDTPSWRNSCAKSRRGHRGRDTAGRAPPRRGIPARDRRRVARPAGSSWKSRTCHSARPRSRRARRAGASPSDARGSGATNATCLAAPNLRRDALAIALTDLVRAGAFGVSLSFAGAVAAAAAAEPARMDFIAQYAAASLVISGRGGSLADPAAILAAEHAAAPDRVALLPFVQPPAVGLLLAPLATLPFEVAFLAMALVDGALILAALVLLLPRTRGTAGTAALLLVAPPAAIAIAQGQTSPLALLFVALAVRRGPRIGGLALGLSLVRLQTAPLLLFVALLDPARRAWALVGALLVVAASAAVVGTEGIVRYADTLVGASEWLVTGEFGHAGSIGWPGLALWLGLAPVGPIASALSLVAGAVAVVRSPGPDRPRVAAAWSLLASPPLLMHDALLAYPAALSAASRRGAWDAVSSFAWIGHVLIAPVAVLWSLALAIGTAREARRP